MESTRELISRRLRQARILAELTQQNAADDLNIHRSAVADLERGARRATDVELRQLSRLYGQPVNWLLGLDRDPKVDGEVTAATQGLTEHDQAAVLAFARFLAHQTLRRS